ncbi:MAG: class I tRNA ligase family protein, partial [Magnetococcales bacterium]|nr:class I tRNA ligase family protein [Magnetococcales bacterium]
QDLHYFCAMDLGAFYLEIVKDRLYCDGADAISRRSAQTVLHHSLEVLVRMMAPILAFTAEEAWGQMAGEREASVHLSAFPEAHPEWRSEDLESRWESFRKVRVEAYRLLELDRREKRVGSFMESSVTLYCSDELQTFLSGFQGLKQLFLVAEIHLKSLTEAPEECEESETVPGLKIVTGKVDHGKCVRCWNRDAAVGSFTDHPELCPRCHEVVSTLPVEAES